MLYARAITMHQSSHTVNNEIDEIKILVSPGRDRPPLAEFDSIWILLPLLCYYFFDLFVF